MSLLACQRLVVIVLLGTVVSACTPKESPQEQHTRALTQAASIAPADERLSVLYKQSCKACHAIENSGAPLVGDHSQWDTRWNKGMPSLMQSAVAGFNGMPAGGQCFACTAADYEALITFLAGRM
jgi:cytochrome c5